MKNVLIADDHEVTRRGIREMLRDEFKGVNVVAVPSGEEVLSALGSMEWDLVLLDILMPGPNIIEVIGSVRARCPKTPILVLTAALEIEYVVQTMKAGASGFIQKHRAVDELIEAIQLVSEGRTYLHADTAAEVAAALHAPQEADIHDTLSEREMEILLLIAKGRAIKEIASDLDLSDKTVATYVGRIREKTGLASYVDMARYALHKGLVD